MAWAVEKGIVTGSDNGLNPKNKASRAQVDDLQKLDFFKA